MRDPSRTLRAFAATLIYVSTPGSGAEAASAWPSIAKVARAYGPIKIDLVKEVAPTVFSQGNEVASKLLEATDKTLSLGFKSVAGVATGAGAFIGGKEKNQDNVVALGRGAVTWGLSYTAVEAGALLACPETVGVGCGVAITLAGGAAISTVAEPIITGAYDYAVSNFKQFLASGGSMDLFADEGDIKVQRPDQSRVVDAPAVAARSASPDRPGSEAARREDSAGILDNPLAQAIAVGALTALLNGAVGGIRYGSGGGRGACGGSGPPSQACWNWVDKTARGLPNMGSTLRKVVPAR